MPLYMEGDRMRSFSYPSILRGARTVMSEHDAFDRVLAAVHAATLDETRWPATSALIDEACGLTGNGLMVAEGPTNDVRALFVGLYARGQRRDDLEREYLNTYHPIDERVPRFRQLPARRLVHITDLYTAEELKTSRTYNELLPRAGMQDSLNVQLPGLAGSHIGWGLNDPVDAEGWGSSRITMVERLLPHIQQFVRVRQVLAGALDTRWPLPRLTSLPRTMIRPLVKLTSSRICNSSSHPALRRAGVMNLVQMSRSLRLFLSIGRRHQPCRGFRSSEILHCPFSRSGVSAHCRLRGRATRFVHRRGHVADGCACARRATHLLG